MARERLRRPWATLDPKRQESPKAAAHCPTDPAPSDCLQQESCTHRPVRLRLVLLDKVGLVELGKPLGTRDSFYRFKELSEERGEEALQVLSRRKPNVKTRVAPEVEEAGIGIALEQPAWCQLRAAHE